MSRGSLLRVQIHKKFGNERVTPNGLRASCSNKREGAERHTSTAPIQISTVQTENSEIGQEMPSDTGFPG